MVAGYLYRKVHEMIPMVGLIVSAYTIPRLVHMGLSNDNGWLVGALAWLGLLATLFLDFALVTTGSSLPKYP